MPEKEWEIFLPDGSRILVYVECRGANTESFVVVLIAPMGGRDVCITRYDTSHGQSHRDVLGRKGGLIGKDWLLSLSCKEAFAYAIKDLKENHECYIQFFEEH